MGLKILTVDDSKTIRMIVARAFKNYACEVFEASDGVEGLTVAQRERPNVIILDLTMPVMDGVEMLTKLKADPELRSIPVVMLTAEAGRENVLRIAKLGVRDYLIKPFKEELIVERVGRIVELKLKNETAGRPKRYDDPLKVLVVDDKPAIIERIQSALSDTPWTVTGVSQAAQAMEFCNQSVPDIALVSLSLPDSAGFLLYQTFRAGARTKTMPILALSVKTAADEQARAQQTGFGGIITKPIDPSDLKLKIIRTLNLDTSYKYFQRRDGVLVVVLPETFDHLVSNDISLHLRNEVYGAVDEGLSQFIVDASRLKAADVTLVKLVLSAIQFCTELDIRYALLGSEAVARECQNYAESKDWQFSNSYEEALAVLNGKTTTMA